MRRTFGGLCVVAALIAPATVSAQSGDVSASATIVAALQVFEEADLNFGSVVPGIDAIVAPGAAVPAGATRGALRIEHSSNFSVTSTVPTDLSDGTNTIPVSFDCGYSSTQNGALNGGSFDCASPNSSPSTTLGTPTTTWLQVGGAILGADTGTTPPGTYSGLLSFQFTATI